MLTQERKIYITFQVANDDEFEWEDSDHESPDDAMDFLIAELRYRIEHLPGGQIIEIETK